MRERWPVMAVAACAALALGGAVILPTLMQGLAASQAEDWSAPRTPWGDPDLQGIWTNENTGTPRERPARFGEREFLSDDEVAELEREAQARYEAAVASDDVTGPRSRADVARTENTIEAGIYGQEYGNVWMEQPQPPGPLRWTRTSLIVSPAHGQVPPYTPEALDRLEAREAARAHRGEADSWEDRNLGERCMRPQAATGLQGTVRIIQAPGWVAILPDGLQYPQLLRLEGREPADPRIRGWFGSARARWEGDTLVIETTNFNDSQGGGPILPSRRALAFYLGSGETLRRVETYERVGPDQIAYGVTTEDPAVYVEPWTELRPMRLDNDFLMLQSGCHEGNYGMPFILSAARADEDYAMRAAQEAAELRKPEIAALRARTDEWLRTGTVRAAEAPTEAVNPDR